MKRNLSYSMINAADCMKKVYYYLNRVGGTMGPAADRGTRIHKAIEEYETLQEEKPLILQNEKEFRAFAVALEKYRELKENPGFKLGPETKLEFHKEGMPVVGVFDMFLNDGTIFDWKFPNKPWNDYKFADYTDKQAWYYFWLLEEYKPTRMVFYVIDFETFEGREYEVPVCWKTVKQKLTVWLNFADSIRSAEAMDHWPASPGMQKCNWCSYKNICESSAV